MAFHAQALVDHILQTGLWGNLSSLLYMYVVGQMKVDPRSYERNYMQSRKEAWKKIQDFNGVKNIAMMETDTKLKKLCWCF